MWGHPPNANRERHWSCLQIGRHIYLGLAFSTSGALGDDPVGLGLPRDDQPNGGRHITKLPFDAEGWRHCVKGISDELGGLVLRSPLPACGLAEIMLGQTCRALHSWFNCRIDLALGATPQWPNVAGSRPAAPGPALSSRAGWGAARAAPAPPPPASPDASATSVAKGSIGPGTSADTATPATPGTTADAAPRTQNTFPTLQGA